MKYILPLFILVVFAVGCGARTQQDDGATASSSSTEANEDVTITPPPETALGEEEIAALDRAIDTQYKAYTLYEQVIAAYGDVEPFSTIVSAEDNPIAILEEVYYTNFLPLPSNAYTDQNLLNDIASVSDACAAGAETEIANAAVYRDELLPAVEENEEMTAAFNTLLQDSEEQYVPAFERCSGAN